jgi:DNA-binding PadR family transcriptional regulator
MRNETSQPIRVAQQRGGHEGNDDMSQLPLRPVEFQILVILAEQPSHGYSIIQETSRRTDGKVKLQPGTLYRAIQRLEDGGFIEEVEAPPQSTSDDERRRYFGLTRQGRAVAAEEAARLAALLKEARTAGLMGGS